MSVRSRPLFAGFFFVAVAGLFFVQSLAYELGTASEMGPAYFPRAVSIALALTGLAIIAAGLRNGRQDETFEPVNLRALAAITGGVVIFALLLRPAGLVAAMMAMVFVARLSNPRFSWLGSILLGISIALLCAGIFVFGLNLRIPLWPGFLR